MKSNRKRIPKDKGIDNSLALLKEGYLFVPNRCRLYQSDIFQTRLLGQKAICMSGKEAAKIFYDNERFKRQGAAPKRVQKTLFGENAIQAMDGAAHQHRKKLFMSLMSKEALEEVSKLTTEKWRARVNKWEKKRKIVFFEEAEEVMCEVACAWAGVPLKDKEVKLRAKEFGQMVDAFGAVGLRHWRGREARESSEKWVKGLIKKVRAQKIEAPEGKALHAMAWHRDLDGNKLSAQMAAIELINVVRPIVAIGRFVTFGMLALHEHPEAREKIKADDDGAYTHRFVQEVRRYYPFGPFTGARVRKNFKWGPYKFKKGTLVILDIYGTTHHSSLWEKPEEFRPERFEEWDGSPFDLIPQGGGDFYKDHRCAGEWVTIEIMKASMEFLTKEIRFDLPEQDLSYSLVRMPSQPKSGIVMRNVQPIGGRMTRRESVNRSPSSSYERRREALVQSTHP